MVYTWTNSKKILLYIFYLSTLIKLCISTINNKHESEEYQNLFENDAIKIRNFIENFNFTEYEEICAEAKYEKCYEMSSFYLKKLKFTNFTEISTKYSANNEIDLDIPKISDYSNKEESKSISDKSDEAQKNIYLNKDEVTLYNNNLSDFYFYAGMSEYYGIIKKKSDLANGFAKFVISAYHGNSKALYELFVILESNIYNIIFHLKQFKSLLQNDILLKYISGSEFYENFKFESDYEKNSIALVFLYTSAILKYPPALNTLAYKFYTGDGVEKSCDTSLKYYKEVSILNVQKIASRKKPNHYEKVNLVAYEYAGFLQSKENMNVNAIIDYLKVEASNGHTNVMQQLGQKFLFGQGIDQNFQESFNYFKLGYLHNDTLCTYYLGEHYLNGWGVEPNYSEAMILFNRAVVQQYDPNANKDKNNKQYVAKALNSIGYIYYHGLGVEKNIKRAYDYFKSI
jgi:TPR repeat protein